MDFDYFYVEQSENYAFYRIPKLLFTEKLFVNLSTEAKVLYGLLLDRISLSREHGWIDEEGRVYVFYTIRTIKGSMRCANTKACGLLRELDVFGLIERKKQGQGKPTIIYVKDFSRFPKPEIKNSDNENSSVPIIGIQDFPKVETNKTDKSKTEKNKTDPILSVPDADGREAYREYLYDHLEMQTLCERYPDDVETLDAILTLMLDVICSKRKYIRIAGDDKPVNVVKSQFLKVGYEHIEYVMDCFHDNGTKVRNIKQYLLAAIYNAPLTMEPYYQAWVNNDRAEGRI